MIQIAKVVDDTSGRLTHINATPKQKAEDLLMDAIRMRLDCWETDNMTDRECDLVKEQMIKISQRIAKLCHFEY